MKRLIVSLLCLATSVSVFGSGYKHAVRISNDVLMDKIMGGWAGQTFGCAFGGPTEFKYNGRSIPDEVEIAWDENNRCKWYFENEPGIYDDIYMDLSFLDVIDRHGMDADVQIFADYFAHATYNLWHANQAARYNILAGIKAPDCGHWTNNPHADDIDFQIEADFAGLVCPGLPSTAAALADKVGHIMNYGDGWYGGLYVATMYSLAFIMDDIPALVREALSAIPPESDFRKCIEDVTGWCFENKDWRQTWSLVQDKWSNETGCPTGVDDPFNIDAKLNSAYVVMGLLYGNGDMDRTIEISTRCGADSDCNPSTAAGILGTVLGFSRIPERWTRPVQETIDINFAHTDISLRKACEMTGRIALQNIKAAGGKIGTRKVRIKTQEIQTARYEKSFDGLDKVKKLRMTYNNFRKPFSLQFEGRGIVLTGRLNNVRKSCPDDYVAEIAVTVDGKEESVLMPIDFATRRFDIYWNYGLQNGPHTIKIVWTNPTGTANLVMDSAVVYDSSAE